MPGEDELTAAAKSRLPPMLFGWIRSDRRLGRPKGEAGDGFTVTVRRREATTYRDRGHGIYDAVPGGWAGPAITVPCFAVPDEEQMHVVSFRAPEVHLTEPLDGYYQVRVGLTKAWKRDGMLAKLWSGYLQVWPPFVNIKIWSSDPIGSVDFEVQHKPFLLFR